MVEKISEASMKVAINIDSAADDGALLNQIAKKKKQKEGGEDSVPVAMLSLDTLVRLTPALAHGGGLLKTEKQAMKQNTPPFFGLAVDSQQMNKGDSLRRQVALAAAGVAAMASHGQKSGAAEKDEATKAVSSKEAALKLLPTTAAATKFQQPVPVQQSPATAIASPITFNRSVPETEMGHQGRLQRTKDDFGEVRPFWQGEKPSESVLPKHGETTMQSKNMPATLQQLKTQASSGTNVVKEGREGQMLEVNYQFQRWSGDHSVKISVPTEARRDGNVTLLPSDVRAADVLLRNMGHLTSLSPDLLRPQQERDEQQQQRRQQQQQDEDQE
ncbi:SpaN/EivJ family type III secretion system needle length determinant [Yersinia hibernica]|uniref:Surface presentation of antigen domain-containing protein n=1 Tax=Yersinia enterocolitica LC20 TaxID=1443113 RepID=A0A7U4K0G2_YEREN|nr:type III secretion system needle length determinant, SpaN/EivJ family [Yersinia hibernica]AHM72790.2 hypothetical protein LC20_01536 [Yersinia hibernica]OVZ78278.1 hypothetical protein CBW54_20895 [Yersinia kristensenii]